MKNIFLFICFLIVASPVFSQMKVHSNGDIGVSNTTSTPRAYLDIDRHDTQKALAQFGTFGIQSFADGNGFLTNNCYYQGGNWNVRYNNQYANVIQFAGPYTLFKISPNAIPAGGSEADANMKSPIIARNNGYVGINGAIPYSALQVDGGAYKTLGGSNWSIPSDKRLKKKIKSFDRGLEYILDMRTVEYEYNGKAGTQDGQYQIGVLAQELKEVAPFMVNEYEYKTSESINPQNVDTKNAGEYFLSMNPSAVKWMLVNAVQEQQSIIDSQEERLNRLEEMVKDLLNSETKIVEVIEGNHRATISNSYPNPTNSNTKIDYYIPNESKLASIRIFDIQGKFISEVSIENFGKGVLDLTMNNIPSGVYSYQLFVDKEVVDTKKLTITK